MHNSENKKKFQASFRVVGAGLAGSEAALRLAESGYHVELFEQKPNRSSAAHKLSGAAELVCSNSLKSLETETAHGLLKAELEILESPLLKLAKLCSIPGGSALTVDREKFSQVVTQTIEDHPLIDFKKTFVERVFEDEIPTLYATGPLTSEDLMRSICDYIGDDSHSFYDATSPVVSLDSLDLDHFFWASRKQEGEGDYLNLALNREQYLSFWNNLLTAEKMPGHLPEEQLQFFEGCLPIEVLAERGAQTLCFGPLKPIGFTHPKALGAEAIIQFRREKAAGELLNMVGFQTRMKWPEQERVFRNLPGMKDAQFVRLGAMHRNSFINTPKVLTEDMSLKTSPHIFFAGQITGSEGYTEAISTGHYVALRMMGISRLPEESCLKSLVRYLVQSDPKYFQPMNFNFGLLPPLDSPVKKMNGVPKKKMMKILKSERSLATMKRWKNEHLGAAA